MATRFYHFTPAELSLYVDTAIKSGDNLDGTDNEVLEVLTVLAAYKEEYPPANYYIGFPIKDNVPEKTLASFLPVFGNIKQHLESKSLVDSRILIKTYNRESYIVPLQLKRVPNNIVNDTQKFIQTLTRLQKKYQKNKCRLVTTYEKIEFPQDETNSTGYRLKFAGIEDWFNKNDFPFKEVILIHLTGNEKREVVFYQFWSKMKGKCREKRLTMNKILSSSKEFTQIPPKRWNRKPFSEGY